MTVSLVLTPASESITGAYASVSLTAILTGSAAALTASLSGYGTISTTAPVSGIPFAYTAPWTGSGTVTVTVTDATDNLTASSSITYLSSVSTIGFNLANFRAMFVQFSNTTTFPDSLLESYFGFATSYISPIVLQGFSPLNPAQQTMALNLMTAHIAFIFTQMGVNGASGPNGFVTSQTVKDVSYTVQPPPEKSQFQYWLNQSPYGQQLYSLLTVAAVGGFYIGGLPETTAFRKWGGIF